MNKRKNTLRLSRDKAHREALLRNLAQDLIVHGKIRTTLAKAKALRPFVEPLITRAKDDTAHARAIVSKYLYKREVVERLFKDVAPKYIDRNGGYTRIVKLGPRAGDGAEAAIIQLVEDGSKKEDDKR